MMDRVLEQIQAIAARFPIRKIVLFGSRARGDHQPQSDYDLAVWDDHWTPVHYARFVDALDEIATLKKIDVVLVHQPLAPELQEAIAKEGITIYEHDGK